MIDDCVRDKLCIDNGFAGDVVPEVKTTELARYTLRKGVQSGSAGVSSFGCAVCFRALTHNLTHNTKRAGGGNGAESTIVSDFLEQKCPQSAEWRCFESGVSVGKDEVSSSNLGGSSKKLLKSLDFGSFCSVFPQNNVGQKVGQAG